MKEQRRRTWTNQVVVPALQPAAFPWLLSAALPSPQPTEMQSYFSPKTVTGEWVNERAAKEGTQTEG